MTNDFYLAVVAVLLSYAGILLSRKNMIFFLIQLETLYNGILLVFITGGYVPHTELSVVYFLVILALIAAEAVVGLVLTILYFKAGRNINLGNMSTLHG